MNVTTNLLGDDDNGTATDEPKKRRGKRVRRNLNGELHDAKVKIESAARALEWAARSGNQEFKDECIKYALETLRGE